MTISDFIYAAHKRMALFFESSASVYSEGCFVIIKLAKLQSNKCTFVKLTAKESIDLAEKLILENMAEFKERKISSGFIVESSMNNQKE